MIDSPEAFKMVSNILMPDGCTPEQKANDLENVLNWVRSPKDNEGLEISPFMKVD